MKYSCHINMVATIEINESCVISNYETSCLELKLVSPATKLRGSRDSIRYQSTEGVSKKKKRK
jgi:hypothetical protein